MKALALLLLLLAGCADARPRYAVALELGGGRCSATKVARNVIAAASHCFAQGRLTAIDGKPAYALKMIRDGGDSVLVRVSVTFTEWARIGPAPKAGDRLTLVGNIWGIGLMYRELVVAGEVTAPKCPFPIPSPCRMILMDGLADVGDSGAGYFDSRGRLVGIHTGTLGMTGRMTVMIPMAFTPQDWKAIK